MEQNPLKTKVSLEKRNEVPEEKLEFGEVGDEELKIFDMERDNSDLIEENLGMSFLLIKGE